MYIYGPGWGASPPPPIPMVSPRRHRSHAPTPPCSGGRNAWAGPGPYIVFLPCEVGWGGVGALPCGVGGLAGSGWAGLRYGCTPESWAGWPALAELACADLRLGLGPPEPEPGLGGEGGGGCHGEGVPAHFVPQGLTWRGKWIPRPPYRAWGNMPKGPHAEGWGTVPTWHLAHISVQAPCRARGGYVTDPGPEIRDTKPDIKTNDSSRDIQPQRDHTQHIMQTQDTISA